MPGERETSARERRIAKVTRHPICLLVDLLNMAPEGTLVLHPFAALLTQKLRVGRLAELRHGREVWKRQEMMKNGRETS